MRRRRWRRWPRPWTRRSRPAYYSGGGAAAVNAVKDNAKELYNNLAGAFMVGQDGLTTTPGFSVTTSNNGATPGSPNG